VTAILAIVVFVATYVLIATERVHRVAAALGGAAAMVLIGAADAESAFFSREAGVDWNVIFLLLRATPRGRSGRRGMRPASRG
jgi:Na+/H+ antiporter NhaD/arsenite permease-like protein